MPLAVTDIVTEVQDALDAAKKERTVVDSVVALVNNQNSTIATLQKDLADAIAAQNPAGIQAASDGLKALVAETTAQTADIAAAVAAGTGTPIVAPTVPVVPPTP